MLGRLEQKRAGALKALALWLGLAALILQGFVPLAAMAAPAGHSIVICTIHGMQTIRIGADGKPVSSQVNPGGSADANMHARHE